MVEAVLVALVPLVSIGSAAESGDSQLDAAIEHLRQELKTHPYTPLERPAYPDRRAMGLPKQDQ